MKPFIKFIVSFLILASAANAMAQDSLQVDVTDTTQIVPIDSLDGEISNSAVAISDSTALKEKPFRFFISIDYGKLITTVAQLDTRYEASAGVEIWNKIRFTADLGYASLAPPNAIENGNYYSTGNYYRVGVDYMVNIMPKIYLSFGGMYAFANFKDEGTVEIKSEVWPSFSQSFERNNFSANWAEFIIISEAPILNRNEGFFSNLYWGIKFRLRIMINRPSPENFDVYAIPGYGRTFNNLVPAGNLFISYKL